MKHKWPIEPTRIIDKSDSITLESDGIGIIKEAYLKGILTEICANIENPVALIEFLPNDNCEITDGILPFLEIHPPCKKFRDCTEIKYCHTNDIIHATLFKNLNEDTVEQELLNRINSNNFIDAISKLSKLKSFKNYVRIKYSKKENIFIEYDCLILGYREVIFPIFFEKNVIGVLIAGQITCGSHLDNINNRRETFYKNHPEVIKLKEEVEIIHNNWIIEKDIKSNKNKNVINDIEYKSLIEKISDSIEDLKLRLKKEITLTRERFIREKLEFNISNLNRLLQENKQKSNGNFVIESFWNVIDSTLLQLVKDFPVRSVIIFAKKNITKTKVNNLDFAASAGNIDKNFINYKYKIDNIDISEIAISSNKKSLLENILFNGENISLDPSIDFIRIVPSPISYQSVLAVWIRYDKKIWDRLSNIENELEAYKREMNTYYTFISSIYSSLLAEFATRKLENTLKVFGHEVGQISSAIDGMRSSYLTNKIDILNASFEIINDDLKGYLHLLALITENSKKLLLENIKVKKDFFYAFNKILYKWPKTYREEILTKNINLFVEPTNQSDILRPKVFADEKLIEQVVYNLINNAIKYCFRGSNIYLDCVLKDNIADSPHLLSITNYGNKIDEQNGDIYSLFVRGENVKYTEGLGIGLYIAKRIADAHSSNIDSQNIYHKSDHISEFNVIIIEAAISIFENSNPFTANRLKDEFLQLKQNGYYKKIVAMNANNLKFLPSEEEILNEYNRPTYENTFIVEIPNK